MTFKQTRGNPFYVLLVLAGLAFSLTACAYAVMTVRGLHADRLPYDRTQDAGESLMAWLDRHGFALMLGELAFLCICCILAITTDTYWNQNESTTVKRNRGEDR